MIRRNPYYIQDNVRLDLRDNKGRFAPPSRAKRFYIYVDDDLVYTGEFPRVRIPIDEKELIISEAISSVYEEYLEDIIDQEIIPEEFEEFEEPEFLEPEEEYEELAEELYRELLEVIAVDDPLSFQELTGELPPIAGSFEEKYKEFQSWKFGGVEEETVAMNQIFKFDLDRPITLTQTNPEVFIEIVKKNIVPAVKQMYDERVQGLDLFLFSLIYTQNVEFDGEIHEVTKGISASRAQTRNWQEFEELVLETVYDHIRNSYKNYLSLSVDGALTTIGFRLENLFETSTGRI